MTDDLTADTLVWTPPERVSSRNARYHTDRDCHNWQRIKTPKTRTVDEARDEGFQPCHDCVGWVCPVCEERTTDRPRSHLLGHREEDDD